MCDKVNPVISEGQTQSSDGYASRQNARSFLRERIDRLHREIHNLEALDGSLPKELPSAADEALWSMLTQYRAF